MKYKRGEKDKIGVNEMGKEKEKGRDGERRGEMEREG